MRLLEARRTAAEAKENLESTRAALDARQRENEEIRSDIAEIRRTARGPNGTPDTLLALHRREGEYEAGAAQLEALRAQVAALASEVAEAEAGEHWESGVADASAIAHEAEALRARLLELAQAASQALSALTDAAPGMLARGRALRSQFARLGGEHVADFAHPDRRDGVRASAFLDAVRESASLAGVLFTWDARPIYGQTLGIGSPHYHLGITGEHRNVVTQLAQLPEEPRR